MRALLLLVIQVSVLADYDLSVQIDTYSNPTHRYYENGCCDRSFKCRDECDNYFVLCLSDGVLTDHITCTLGVEHTGYVGQDDIEFGTMVGGLENPIIFNVHGRWPGTIFLLIGVYDYDYHFFPYIVYGYEFVDVIVVNETLELDDTFTASTTYEGHFIRGYMAMSFKVECSQYYYQEDCNTFCEPVAGQYSCSDEGERECEDNYYGLNCSVFCKPVTDRHTCRNDGNMECVDNYYGTNCSVFCKAVEGQYNCDEEGKRACSKGYYGTECLVFCVASDDESGHYYCDSSNGTRVCLEGYREPETNCTKADGGHLLTPPTSAGAEEANTDPLSGMGAADTGAIVGGVTGGVAVAVLCILIAIVALYLYQRRKRTSHSQAAGREHLLQIQQEETGRPNVIIGENPNYLPAAMGRHIGARTDTTVSSTSNSFQLEVHNPLYSNGARSPSYISIDHGSQNGEPSDGIYSSIDHRETQQQPPYLPGSISSGSEYVASSERPSVNVPHLAEAGSQPAVGQRQVVNGVAGAAVLKAAESASGGEFEALYTFMPDT